MEVGPQTKFVVFSRLLSEPRDVLHGIIGLVVGLPWAVVPASADLRLLAGSANDGFRELTSLYVASTRSCGILILDNRSRMGFLDSAHRRRVSRRKTRWKCGHRPSSLFFFSAACDS